MIAKRFFIYGMLLLTSFLLVVITACEKDSSSDNNGSDDELQGQLTKMGEVGNTFHIVLDEPIDGFDIGNIAVVSTDGEKSNLRAIATIDNPLLGEIASVMIDRYPEFTSYDGANIEVNIGMKFTEDGISFMGTGEPFVKSGAADQEQIIIRYDAEVGDIFSTSLHGKTLKLKVVARHAQQNGDMLELELIEHDVPNLISLFTFYTALEGFVGGVATFESGTEISFGVTSSKPNEPIDFGDHEFGSMTDSRDGTTYKTIQIGNQVWMAENLAYLPSVAEVTSASYTIPYYYVYGYSGTDTAAAKATDNYKTYGVLYNWPAAMDSGTSSSANPSGVQGACPEGWHLPSDDQWTQLTDYLGGASVAGGKLKATGTTHWKSPNTDATNETGFTGLPGGYYNDLNERFNDIESYGYWWSATENDTDRAFYRVLLYLNSDVLRLNSDKAMGLSVRCVKDN